MLNRILILFLLLNIPLTVFSSENLSGETLKSPVGKISVKSMIKISDESGNIFKYYKNFQNVNINIKDFFSKFDFLANDFNLYKKRLLNFNIFLSFSLSSYGCAVLFSILLFIPFLKFDVRMIYTFTILSIAFSVTAVVFMILAIVFGVLTKKQLKQLCNKYNETINTTSSNITRPANIEYEFLSFKFN